MSVDELGEYDDDGEEHWDEDDAFYDDTPAEPRKKKSRSSKPQPKVKAEPSDKNAALFFSLLSCNSLLL